MVHGHVVGGAGTRPIDDLKTRGAKTTSSGAIGVQPSLCDADDADVPIATQLDNIVVLPVE
jgi:hypothetical protein